MNARFHLPGITSHFKFNLVFAEVLKQYPQYFRDGVEIASVYGTFRRVSGTAAERRRVSATSDSSRPR